MRKSLKILAVAGLYFLLMINLAAEVRIIAVTPKGRVEGIDANNTITVTFNKPMVPLQQLPEGDGTGPLEINPLIKGKYRWQGTSTLSFTPDGPLMLASEYEVTVPGETHSEISGEQLMRSYSWKFETLRPELIMSYPYEDDRWVELDERIFLLFNQKMDPEKVKQHILLKEKNEFNYELDIDFNVRYMVMKDTAALDDRYNRHYRNYQILQATWTHVLIVEPEDGMKKDCSYSLELRKDLPAAEGNLGFLNQRVIHFKTYRTFKFIRNDSWDGLEPTGGVSFIFTNPVRIRDFYDSLTIEPELKIPEYSRSGMHFSYCNNNCECCPIALNSELKPNTTYYVKIKGSLTDKYGQSLGEDIETCFVSKDYAPRVIMPEGMGTVEWYLEPQRYPVKLLNLDKLKLQKALIDREDIVPFSLSRYVNPHREISPPKGFTIDKIWEPQIRRNELTLLPIELNEVTGQAKRGIVFLQLDAMKTLVDGRRYLQALLQVTALGITVKFSPDGNLIYLSYLKSGNPAQQFDIELRDDSNNVLWEGVTDNDGFARTPGWEELNIVPERKWANPRIWVIASKDKDIAFISSGRESGIQPWQFNIPFEYYPEYPKYGGHIFTERGIYRPGETAYIKGIIREKRFGKWEVPRIKEYDLFIKDSRDTELSRTDVTLNEYGAFHYECKLDKDAPTGYYSIVLWQKGLTKKQGVAGEYEDEDRYSNDRKIRMEASFRVEEYKPATFEVTVGYDSPEYIIGDVPNISVNGRYLFGAPMAEADITYTMRLEQAYYSPEGFKGYRFNSSADWGRYFRSPGIVASGKAKLDKEGNFNIEVPVKPGSVSGTVNLISEITAVAPDRQQLSGRKTALIHGAEYYIGLKPQTTFLEKGRKFDIDMLTVAPAGDRMSGVELVCSLKRQEWNSVRKAEVSGRLAWHTEKLDVQITTFTVLSGTGAISWSYTPDKSGYYIFSCNGSDSKDNKVEASLGFYVTGEDYCAWARGDDDKIDLICDQEKYKPGDTARILVKSPYEKANAVVTLEREGIIDQWRMQITGSADTISIPIKPEHLPNVFVCVMLYQGRAVETKYDAEGEDLGKPSFKIGYTNLPVDTGTKRLTVTVESDRKEYRPGEDVSVKVNVLDHKSSGVRSEVTVSAVDLGILNLINYGTPDPFPHFYGPRPLSVETAESRLHIIGQRNYGEKGENRGGSGGIMVSGFDIRKKFIPTVYWNPGVMTDDKGDATVKFTLPDNLTAFRIMATAQTKDSSFGAGDSRFLVSKPLVLKPSLPRFARWGDSFSGGVLCHNNTDKDGTVKIEVRAAGVQLDGVDKQEINIPKGGAKEVRFDFIADRKGTAEFVFTAMMGDEKDALKWTIPVKLPKPTEAVATYASTLDSSEEAIKVPSNIYDEASSINIALAPTALVGLKGGLEYLYDYPYGCLEQKTSKTLPLILAGDLIEIFDLAPLKEHTARELITEYLTELPQFQMQGGGFTFWKEGECRIPSPYLTAYVLWAVSQSKKNGYAVNEDMRVKAAEYLKKYIRGDKSGWEWPYNINAELCTKSFCVYALSVNGYSEQAYINNLYEKLDQIPVFGKIYLMKAIKNERMRQDMVDRLVDEIYNKAKFAPTEVHFEESDSRGLEWIWHSNVRLTALALQGILEVKGEYPNSEKIARWLASERKSGRWLTTQENIYVFYAFNEYVQRYEKETPDFTARVMIDSKKIIEEMFKGRSLTAKSATLAVSEYPRDKQLPVVFEKKGKGRLYYDFRMLYAPRGILLPREEGLKVEKTVEPFKTEKSGKDSYLLSGRYKVTLKVTTDQERHFVVLEDPLPAGFEVINLSFATESREDTAEFNSGSGNSFYRWWGTFDHWEKYDDRVQVFANYLERGEHTYSYLVQATTPGEFMLPSTKAEEMYTPEVFGRTGQKKITVR